MSSLSARRLHRYWVGLCIILLLVSGVCQNIYAAAIRNYLGLQYLRSLQAAECPMQLSSQISKFADSMPGDNRINRAAGMCLLVAGDYGSALKYLFQAQSTKTEDRITFYWMGMAYAHMGDYANALMKMYQAGNLDYFSTLPEDMPDEELEDLAQRLVGHSISAHAHFELAKRVYRINPSLAQQHFEQAFRAASGDLHYSLDAARFLYDQRDFEAARLFGERARSRFPAQPWVDVFWGTLNRATGNHEQAIRDLEKVIARFPSDKVSGAAHLELSKVYILREEYDIAIEHLEAASHLQEEQLWIHLQLSRAYAGLQECGIAQEQLVIADSLVKTDQQKESFSHFEEIVHEDCPQP